MVEVTKRNAQSTELWSTAPHKDFFNSSASTHRMVGVSEITGNVVPSDISFGATAKDKILARVGGELFDILSGEEKAIILKRVLHVLDVEHSLVSVS